MTSTKIFKRGSGPRGPRLRIFVTRRFPGSRGERNKFQLFFSAFLHRAGQKGEKRQFAKCNHALTSPFSNQLFLVAPKRKLFGNSTVFQPRLTFFETIFFLSLDFNLTFLILAKAPRKAVFAAFLPRSDEKEKEETQSKRSNHGSRSDCGTDCNEPVLIS